MGNCPIQLFQTIQPSGQKNDACENYHHIKAATDYEQQVYLILDGTDLIALPEYQKRIRCFDIHMPIFTGVKQNTHIECAIIKISYDYANQRNSFRGNL